MLEDIEFRLRVRVESNSPEAIILNYLNSKYTLYPAKDMAMIALLSYWLPLAHRDTCSVSPEHLGRVLQDSIYRLKLHLQYLQQMQGEEIQEIEVIPDIVKLSESPLEVTPEPLPENDSGSRAETNAVKPETEDEAEQQTWFNPMKSAKSR